MTEPRIKRLPNGKWLIPKIEFYITNVCNLTCTHCNRFNNYNFKGFQLWAEYEADLTKWSEYVEFEQVIIMGGEPLLNPSILDWITGLKRLWPDVNPQILTNGLHMAKVRGLYDVLVDTGAFLWIGIHNLNHVDYLRNQMDELFTLPLREVTDETGWHNQAYRRFFDANDIIIHFEVQNEFNPSALHINDKGRYALRESEVESAHKDCEFYLFGSYQMIEGKIYKCAPGGYLFAQFDEQHDLDLSPEDKELIRAYKPLSVHEVETIGEDFFAHIDDPLPQCKFCPSFESTDKTPVLIYPEPKGKSLT